MKINYTEDRTLRCGTCAHYRKGFCGHGLCMEGCEKTPATGSKAGPGIGESTVVDWETYFKYKEWMDSREVIDTGVCDDYTVDEPK